MIHRLQILSLAALFSLASLALATVPAFEKGDRVTFIGDSITHGGSYHPAIYLFYATRFPNQPFAAYNCGISGDTTPDTNKRFDTDIAPHQPNVATVMLGMNDAWAWCFAADHPLHSKLAGQANAYNTYTTAMDQLATTLSSMNCRIIFIKPSIYDQTADVETTNLVGKNDQLVRFGSFLESLAVKHNGSIVDFTTPMLSLNHTLQSADPSATIVGKDRVHPGAPGHFVMAYHFLKAQNMPQYVSAIRLDANGNGKVLQALNCEIKNDLVVTPESVRFTATEQALPFPVSATQIKALDWVPFQHELNRQVLAVDHLNTGTYELTIDNITIGQYSAVALKQGIDLSDNQATPQYQQAVAVKALHDQQLAATSKLRSIAHVRHTMLSKIEPAIPENDHQALTAGLKAHVEQSKGKPWYGYLNTQVNVFLKSLPNEANYQQDEAKYQQQMWSINQPAPHTWSLQKISD